MPVYLDKTADVQSDSEDERKVECLCMSNCRKKIEAIEMCLVAAKCSTKSVPNHRQLL